MSRGNVLVLLCVFFGMLLVGCKTEEPTGGDKKEPGGGPGNNPGGGDNIAVMQAWERKVERARGGLPTDFDDDGFEEYLQWTDKSGVIHVELKSPDGDFYFLSELHPDETKVTLYDIDGDGTFDQRLEEKPDGSRVYLFDTNDDGVFDERVTITYNFDKNEQERVFEKLQPDKSWKETGKDTVSIHKEATLLSKTEAASGTSANVLQGFGLPQYATPYNSSEHTGFGNNLEIKTSGAGTCDDTQTQKIQNAFNSIFLEQKLWNV